MLSSLSVLFLINPASYNQTRCYSERKSGDRTLDRILSESSDVVVPRTKELQERQFRERSDSLSIYLSIVVGEVPGVGVVLVQIGPGEQETISSRTWVTFLPGV